VTPGGWQANELYKQSKMHYIWELACWIANGMTHGKCGYANWIKIAIFAKPENKPKIEQDFLKVTIKTSETTQTEHKGRKPYPLMEWLIDMFSKEGDVVIDPFGGSGTTLLQCEKMGRICYTAEIDPQYCKDIIKRHKDEITNS
jgi:DNA modification methylase